MTTATVTPFPVADASVQMEYVSPERAALYLAQNTHNRALKPRTVATYAADMAAGAWNWNGESVKFARDGRLLDGQHRLAAIVKSRATVQMLVIRNLPNSVQETMDGGAKRTFADVLNLRGEKHYITLASTCRAVAQWECGDRMADNNVHSNAQLIGVLERYPWLRDGCNTIKAATTTANLPGRVGGLVWWLTQPIDKEDSDHFFARLCSDENHHAGEPIYELRKLLIRTSQDRGERSTRLLSAVTIKAWNKYRAGETIGLLKFRAGGANPEAFPEPK